MAFFPGSRRESTSPAPGAARRTRPSRSSGRTHRAVSARAARIMADGADAGYFAAGDVRLAIVTAVEAVSSSSPAAAPLNCSTYAMIDSYSSTVSDGPP